MAELDIGVLGLGVMGRNLVLNLAEKGFGVAGWDAWPEPVDRLRSEAFGSVQAFTDLGAFVRSVARPRRIILLVKAGQVVDDTLAKLTPLLDAGDVVVDGGNEKFSNTERRAAELNQRQLAFFGMGVSGGEEGARHGPSMMPGGDREAYGRLEPVLQKIAAQVEDGPCVTYIGSGGAGHYVKMVHNGIEYGDMQLIAEAYAVLKHLGGFSNAQLGDIFAEWNRGELESFLIEISARIFRKRDGESGADLLDVIKDSASMKGTGKWTVQDAAELGVPVPTIAAAVDARLISADRDRRIEAAKILPGPNPGSAAAESGLVDDVRAALYAAKCVSYAQGMALIQRASAARGWGVNLSELARIWKGGCIIRARLLGRIQDAYGAAPDLSNLLLDAGFVRELEQRQVPWRRVLSRCLEAGLAVPALSASLGYYDALRSAWLPANLVQAQRDLFGAHTFERLDKPGQFHVDW